MKSIKRLIAVLVACVAIAVPASAQFAFGIKAGAKINELNFSKNVLDDYNSAGFTGGVMAEFIIPVIGLGVDASLMYVYAPMEIEEEGIVKDTEYYIKNSYLEIPINLKYKLSLPAVEKIVAPYIFTGPSFAFLLSEKAIANAYEQNAVDFSWNLGIGVELFDHLQIGASYGWGLNNALQKYELYTGQDTGNWIEVPGKKNCWTITAAYVF